jgi:hypothetical protein
VREMRVALLSLAVALFLLGGSCSREKEEMPVPPRDVPKYRVAKFVSREVGPGGYKVNYATQSSPETVKAYFQSSLVAKKWEPVSDSRDPDGSEMVYFRKKQRLLLVYLRAAASESGSGCDFSISETMGEGPRGNIRINAVPDEESATEASHPSGKEKKH